MIQEYLREFVERAMNKNNRIYFNSKPIELPKPVALPPGGDSPSGEGFSIGEKEYE